MEDAARLIGSERYQTAGAIPKLMERPDVGLLKRLTTGSNLTRKASTYVYLPLVPETPEAEPAGETARREAPERRLRFILSFGGSGWRATR